MRLYFVLHDLPTPCDLFGLMTVDPKHSTNQKTKSLPQEYYQQTIPTPAHFGEMSEMLPAELQSPKIQHRVRLNLVDGNGKHPWNQSLQPSIISVSVHLSHVVSTFEISPIPCHVL